jgi:hypothetical protein
MAGRLDFVVKFFGRLVRIRSTRAELPDDCEAMYFAAPNARIHLRPNLRGKAFFRQLVHETLHHANWHWAEEAVTDYSDDLTDLAYRDDVLARCGLMRIPDPED